MKLFTKIKMNFLKAHTYTKKIDQENRKLCERLIKIYTRESVDFEATTYWHDYRRRVLLKARQNERIKAARRIEIENEKNAKNLARVNHGRYFG